MDLKATLIANAQKAASTASEATAKIAELADKAAEVAVEAAHVTALAKGIPVAKALDLKRIILNNGATVHPTPEGYFIALSKEIAEHLDYYSKMWNMVEIITPEEKK